MSRVFWTGIEMGDTLEWDTVYTTTGTVSLETTVVRSGVYSLKLYGQGIGNCYVQHDLATPVSELYVRVGFQFDTNNVENAAAISFLSASAELGSVYVGSDNVLHADIGGSDVATGSTTLQVDTWYLLEAWLKVDDSAGVFQVRLDGTSEISFSGDTKPGSETNIASMRSGGGVTWASTGTTYIDDIAINDTTGSVDNSWCGDGHVELYEADGAGDHTGLSIGGSSPPANNWQAVDDIPANDDTDYTYSSTPGDYDLYTVADTTDLSSVDIKRARVEARAKESVASTGTVALMVKTGGTEYTGSAQSLLTSYSLAFQEEWRLNPATGLAWTIAELDALQAGVKVG